MWIQEEHIQWVHIQQDYWQQTTDHIISCRLVQTELQIQLCVGRVYTGTKWKGNLWRKEQSIEIITKGVFIMIGTKHRQ